MSYHNVNFNPQRSVAPPATTSPRYSRSQSTTGGQHGEAQPLQLRETVQPSVVTGRRVVLAIGAHPDDVEIGVGGTLLYHRAMGDRVVIVTLTDGARGGDVTTRMREARRAATVLDADLYVAGLPDTELPAGGATIGAIGQVLAKERPDLVYTHTSHDLHQDHRAAHEASKIACRHVSFLACYESPSTTVDFHPNRFIPIDDYLSGKLAAIAEYLSQTSKAAYLDPELRAATCRFWGRFGSSRYAEALEIICDSSPLPSPTLTGPVEGQDGTIGALKPFQKLPESDLAAS